MAHLPDVMDSLFRKHFWAVNLAFILLATWLVARTVNAFVASALAPAPSSEPAARSVRTVSGPQTQLNLEALASLLGLPLPEPPVAISEPESPALDPNAAPVKSDLRVQLLGTLVSSDPMWSFASIQDAGSKKTATYMVGDQILGATVLDIERERVIINNGGRKEYIDGVAGSGSAPVTAAVTRAAPAAREEAQESGIRQINDNTYEVERATIDRHLNDLNKLATQARIVPAFKDDKVQGFKFFAIRPNSLYSQIGVKNGDIVRRINGFELNSPEKALELYAKMKNANRIDIELERNGQVVKNTFNVR